MMSGIFDAIWQLIKAIVTSDLAKSPAGGAVVGLSIAALGLFFKSIHDRQQARIWLLTALKHDAATTWEVIERIRNSFPQKAEVDLVVSGVESGTLDFKTLNRIPAGWRCTPINFPVADIIGKLKPDEAKTAIEFVDNWTRLVERERGVYSAYMKLVDLTPHLADKTRQIQLREIADQLRGNIGRVRTAVDDLNESRHVLEHLAASGARTVAWPKRTMPPIEKLKWPPGWDDTPPSETLPPA